MEKTTNKLKSYALSNEVRPYMEKAAGRCPVWDFPPIPTMEDGTSFEPLTYQNRHALLEMFQDDTDEWVDKQFKDPRKLYSYVGMVTMGLPYSDTFGGCDWLVKTADSKWAGILHVFSLSKKEFGYSHRQGNVGCSFAEKYRGSGFPTEIVGHFQQYLYTALDLLCLRAEVDKDNTRSIRFMKKLGFEEGDYIFFGENIFENPDGSKKEYVPKTLAYYLFRSDKVKEQIVEHERKSFKELGG